MIILPYILTKDRIIYNIRQKSDINDTLLSPIVSIYPRYPPQENPLGKYS